MSELSYKNDRIISDRHRQQVKKRYTRLLLIPGLAGLLELIQDWILLLHKYMQLVNAVDLPPTHPIHSHNSSSLFAMYLAGERLTHYVELRLWSDRKTRTENL